jgi:hypothetical protein
MKVRYVFLLFLMEVLNGPGGPQASLKRLLVDSGGKTPTVKKFNLDGVRVLVERGEPIVYTTGCRHRGRPALSWR